PICLDTEGAQIRTGDLVDGAITMRDNTIVRAHARRVPGDDKNFSLYPPGITEQLEVGDFISIDFNSVLVQVVGVDPEFVSMRVLHGGRVGQNKAVTVERDIPISPLSEKDVACLELGLELGLHHFALSFANAGSDVDEIRQIVGEDAFVISKIESL
ncbi:MAG: sulfate adenylyltransferase, partial [Gemmatimonadetes bacterium]|nr:sulfate adenylyltransferase [Gemmatimonadota bacterium]